MQYKFLIAQYNLVIVQQLFYSMSITNYYKLLCLKFYIYAQYVVNCFLPLFMIFPSLKI